MKSLIFSYLGKRKTNEDSCLEKTLESESKLYLISDGMGGYDNGEIASNIVIDSISTFLNSSKELNNETVQKGINKANLAIRQYQEKNDSKLGATVGGVIVGDNSVKVFWVGDVKIFLFRDNQLYFESKPHNLINEVMENGSSQSSITLSKYSHIVTRSIQGKPKKSIADYVEINLQQDKDTIIICSDGVHDIIDSFNFEKILNDSPNINETMNQISKRIKNESIDNASIILLKLDKKK